MGTQMTSSTKKKGPFALACILPIAIAACGNSDECMNSLDGACGGSSLFDVDYCSTNGNAEAKKSYEHSRDIAQQISSNGQMLYACRISTNLRSVRLSLDAKDSDELIQFSYDYLVGEAVLSLNQENYPFGVSVYDASGKTHARRYLGTETKVPDGLDPWAEASGKWIAPQPRNMPKFAKRDQISIPKTEIASYISAMEKQANVPHGTIDTVRFSFAGEGSFPIVCQVVREKGASSLNCQHDH